MCIQGITMTVLFLHSLDNSVSQRSSIRCWCISLSQHQTLRLLLIHGAEEIASKSDVHSKHIWHFAWWQKNALSLCLYWTPITRNPHCSKSQRTRWERKVNQLQGLHGMSSRRKSQSKMRVNRADDFLCDVLLSGWPVNVSDHTLHHPLNAFVYSIPCEGSTRLD